MRLPLLVSVPHAGRRVPDDVRAYCVLAPDEVARDSDEGAAEIYALAGDVERFITTDVARAIVDLNRSEADRRKDGVVKTHTCWDVPVYDPFPPERVVEQLLEAYYRPYHWQLTEWAGGRNRAGLDCHTMAASGPPVGPDPGVERPWVCLSNGEGTCPQAWIDSLARCFEEQFGPSVSINAPFTGGYITRRHASEMPWIQVELSRGPFLSTAEKHEGVRGAIRSWCRTQFHV